MARMESRIWPRVPLALAGRGVGGAPRLFIGLGQGQKDLIGQARQKLPALHRLLCREVAAMRQLDGGVVQALTEEGEGLDGVAETHAALGQLLAVVATDVPGLVQEARATAPARQARP